METNEQLKPKRDNEYFRQWKLKNADRIKVYQKNYQEKRKAIRNNPHEITVYVLSDPRTMQPKYIGETSELKKRIHNHINNAHKYPNRNARWLVELKSLGLKPIVEVIDTIMVKTRIESVMWEQYYISLYRSWGFDLHNRFVKSWKPVKSKRKDYVLSEDGLNRIIASNIKRKGLPLKKKHRAVRTEVFKELYALRTMEDVCSIMGISTKTYSTYYQIVTGQKFKKKYTKKNKTENNI